MRRTIIPAVVRTLLPGTALPALAGGTAHRGSGGFGYTAGTPGILTRDFGNHRATASGTVYHGFFTGSRWWEVYLASTESGWCVT